MNDLTDEAVVERLARFEGWKWEESSDLSDANVRGFIVTAPTGMFQITFVEKGQTIADYLPRYCLTSRDALAGPLAKLSESQWGTLMEHLHKQWEHEYLSVGCGCFEHWLLTCPPSVLARAIAEVVVDL